MLDKWDETIYHYIVFEVIKLKSDSINHLFSIRLKKNKLHPDHEYLHIETIIATIKE